MYADLNIRKWRSDAGLSQQQLAEQAGVSLPTIQNLEGGLPNPTLETLKKVGLVLGYNFLPSRVAVDWEALSLLGLPISTMRLKKNERQRRDLKTLNHELFVACLHLKNEGSEEREKESIEALILALSLHFPTHYRRVFQKSIIHKFLPKQITARHIKLSRISKNILAEYL